MTTTNQNLTATLQFCFNCGKAVTPASAAAQKIADPKAMECQTCGIFFHMILRPGMREALVIWNYETRPVSKT